MRSGRVSLFGRAVLTAVLCCAAVGAAPAETVHFADPNLEEAVLWQLDYPWALTDAEMQRLTMLGAGCEDIHALDGLEHATNLASLCLECNQISDLTPLASLARLRELSMGSNPISDLTALAGLTNLTDLCLCCGQIRDLTPLGSLTNLAFLDLSHNQISNLPPLGGLTNLMRLRLQGNHISDTAPLATLTNLSDLWLGHNQIRTLDLRGGDLSSLRCLAVFDNPLEAVLLSDVTFSQPGFDAVMAALADVPGVRTLDLSGVDFAAISYLGAMGGLDDLQELHMVGATHLHRRSFVGLPWQLDSLTHINVAGTWDDLDDLSRAYLSYWGAVAGHTLIRHRGDADADGDVDLDDFATLKRHFGTAAGATWALGDFDADGDVDFEDFVILKHGFGTARP